MTQLPRETLMKLARSTPMMSSTAEGVLDVVVDLVRAVGLVSESASEHVDGHSSEVLGQHGRVRAERLPMPACPVQHHKRWRVP
jgi:hypothetical protein